MAREQALLCTVAELMEERDEARVKVAELEEEGRRSGGGG
jgi:hypothetical protein